MAWNDDSGWATVWVATTAAVAGFVAWSGRLVWLFFQSFYQIRGSVRGQEREFADYKRTINRTIEEHKQVTRAALQAINDQTEKLREGQESLRAIVAAQPTVHQLNDGLQDVKNELRHAMTGLREFMLADRNRR